MMFGNWGYGGPGFFGMGFVMLLFWTLLIVGVVVLLRWLATGRSRRAPPAGGSSALEILAQRYARGEIDRAEFEQKRRDLGAL
jgi:putative membrane protein